MELDTHIMNEWKYLATSISYVNILSERGNLHRVPTTDAPYFIPSRRPEFTSRIDGQVRTPVETRTVFTASHAEKVATKWYEPA